jgi:hypothetical protein
VVAPGLRRVWPVLSFGHLQLDERIVAHKKSATPLSLSKTRVFERDVELVTGKSGLNLSAEYMAQIA